MRIGSLRKVIQNSSSFALVFHGIGCVRFTMQPKNWNEICFLNDDDISELSEGETKGQSSLTNKETKAISIPV